MLAPSSRPLNRLVLRTAVAVAAGLLLAVPAARASCGDYLEPTSGGHSRTATPPDDSKPCSGPTCSHAPQPSPAPPAPVPPVQADDLALLPPSSPAPTTNPATRRSDDSPWLPARHGAEVFHPPRPDRPHVSL